MRITFKLYATLQDYLPPESKKTNAVVLDVDAQTSVAQLIERYGLPRKSCHLVLVDGHFVPVDDWTTRILKDGETLAIWPPVAGG